MAANKRNRNDMTGAAGTRGTGGTVVGLFERRGDAERAINDLLEVGFSHDQIGIASRNAEERERLGESTGVEAHDLGAKVGTGALVGGALGALASLLIPGIGPVVAAGTLGTVLAGAGIGAGVGSLVGALTAWGVSEEEAKHFEQGFSRGGTLVTVHAGARATEARGILHTAGADLGPSHAGTFSGTQSAQGTRGTARTDETRRMELREEELDVSKRSVEAGEVRLRKDVVTEQKQIDVPVTREEVVIERRPASGRPAAAGDMSDIRAGEEIRVPIREEQVDVTKRPVVKEEISVGKRKVTGTEHVRDTVRREEAHVEGEGHVGMTGRTTGEANEPWRGNERRYHDDPSFTGPERRRHLQNV